jgi:RNA polymerase sigma-70 factor (ECF subfamily)
MAQRFTSVMTGASAMSVPAPGGIAARDRVGALFDAHHRRLYTLARRLSPNADEARDLVQETFLRAARATASIPAGAGPEEAWLVRVLVNICRDRWRRSATRKQHRSALLAGQGSPDAESALVARMDVWDALRSLAPRRRTVVVMHELEGVATKQIARMLGVAEVTVRWHLARGKRDLRRMLGKEADRP